MYTVNEIYWNLAASEWVRPQLAEDDQNENAIEPFGWRGEGSGRFEDIDWRHPAIKAPTEAQLREAWATFVTAETDRENAKAAKLTTLTDFVTAASTMQSQLNALIAANTADLTALASDRDIPDALKPYLTRIIQRSAAAIQAQTGAFQVAMVLAGQYASNPNSIQTVP